MQIGRQIVMVIEEASGDDRVIHSRWRSLYRVGYQRLHLVTTFLLLRLFCPHHPCVCDLPLFIARTVLIRKTEVIMTLLSGFDQSEK